MRGVKENTCVENEHCSIPGFGGLKFHADLEHGVRNLYLPGPLKARIKCYRLVVMSFFNFMLPEVPGRNSEEVGTYLN